jgi:hypothetical protein
LGSGNTGCGGRTSVALNRNSPGGSICSASSLNSGPPAGSAGVSFNRWIKKNLVRNQRPDRSNLRLRQRKLGNYNDIMAAQRQRLAVNGCDRFAARTRQKRVSAACHHVSGAKMLSPATTIASANKCHEKSRATRLIVYVLAPKSARSRRQRS